MITLYGSLPGFGMPELSPFVAKARILLKMANLPHTLAKGDFQKAPKGKVPYIDDAGQVLGDSTFIRWHLEQKYGIDFDKGLTPAERGIAWAFEKMADEHLYWIIVHERWTKPQNYEKVSKLIFADMPALLRPVLVPVINKRARGNLKGQGIGRHNNDDVIRLASADIDAIANQLGTKPWLMGNEPCSADASVWSAIIGCQCPAFDTPLRAAVDKHQNLKDYVGRGMARWFADGA